MSVCSADMAAGGSNSVPHAAEQGLLATESSSRSLYFLNIDLFMAFPAETPRTHLRAMKNSYSARRAEEARV